MTVDVGPEWLFGARVVLVIDERRRDQRITEAEFSRSVGHASGWWRRMTKGRELDFAHFYRACKAINVPAWSVLREVERRWPS